MIDISKLEHIVGIRLQNVDEIYLHELRKFEKQSYNGAKVPVLERLMADPKREIITANVYRRDAMRKLDAVMTRRGIAGFGLIVSRPQGAFDYRHIYPHAFSFHEQPDLFAPIYLPLLDRVYKRLSYQNGELYTQIPQVPKNEAAVAALYEYLLEIPGINVTIAPATDYHFVHYVMRLVKQPDAPASLLCGAHK